MYIPLLQSKDEKKVSLCIINNRIVLLSFNNINVFSYNIISTFVYTQCT